MTYCVSSRAIFYACGTFALLSSSIIQMIELRNLTLAHKSSWVDAFQNKPISFQLISPLLALQLASEINQSTAGPVYVNGFTLGDVDKGGVIQMMNASKEYGIFCANGFELGETFIYEILSQGTYEEGRRNCLLTDSHFIFLLTIYTLDMISHNFRNTWFWMDDSKIDIPALILDYNNVSCMVLDLSEGGGTLMLDNCDRPHIAAYVKLPDDESYKPVIKRYTDSLEYPLYDPKKMAKETTNTAEDGNHVPNVVLTRPGGNTSKVGLNLIMYIAIPVGLVLVAALIGLFVWKQRRKLSTGDCHKESRSRGGLINDSTMNDHETIPEQPNVNYGNVNNCGAINGIYDEQEGVIEDSDNIYMNSDNCVYSLPYK